MFMKNEKQTPLTYAGEKLKPNNQTLRRRKIKPYSRWSINSRDVQQNEQTVLLHMYNCPYVTIEYNVRGKLAFFMKKGFNSHHMNRNKCDDVIKNLIVIEEKNHKFCDFYGDKFVSGVITYEEYYQKIKPFIVWEYSSTPITPLKEDNEYKYKFFRKELDNESKNETSTFTLGWHCRGNKEIFIDLQSITFLSKMQNFDMDKILNQVLSHESTHKAIWEIGQGANSTKFDRIDRWHGTILSITGYNQGVD